MRILALFSIAALVAPGFAQLNPGFNVDQVRDRMLDLATKSWEQGTAAQALLELVDPQYSVFGSNPFGGAPPNIQGLAYAQGKIQLGSNQLTNGDGSSGDPAALGVFATMLGGEYLEAAKRQYNELVNNTPKWPNGAISHRMTATEVWADNVYMVPPFFAYYGAAINDAAIIRQAFEQCHAYRQALGGDGLWNHIDTSDKGGNQDDGKWSTGNAWVVGGMARVLATMQKTTVGGDWAAEISQLKDWIKEILHAVMYSEKDGGLVRNYMPGGAGGPNFGEVSGTALLAATAYRMHTIDENMFGADFVKFADEAREELGRRVDGNGIVAPAVDPMWWKSPSPVYNGSPEGNAFAVLLYTAWRDCVEAGKCSNFASFRAERMGRRSWLDWTQRKN